MPKRGIGGRGGLALVPRGQLTIIERAGHVRRLRRIGEMDEATALETEATTLINGGGAALNAKRRSAFFGQGVRLKPPKAKRKPK